LVAIALATWLMYGLTASLLRDRNRAAIETIAQVVGIGGLSLFTWLVMRRPDPEA
jgi:hypothetical protein